MGETVKVHGLKISPFSMRVELGLTLKEVDYEFIEEDLAKKSPELLKYNPVYKKIPVLLHNGLPLPESLVILEYIDDVWSQNYPLLPRDPYHKAVALLWARFIDDKVVTSLFKGIVEGDEKEIEEGEEYLRLLEGELKRGGKKFFGGERIGLVDIVGNFIAFWIGVLQEAIGRVVFTQEKLPRLYEWALDFNSVEVVKENLPDRKELLDFFIARFGALKS